MLVPTSHVFAPCPCSDYRGRTADIFEAIGHPSSCKLGWVSRVLCKWLSDPKPTRILGTKMVQEMAMFTPVLSLEVEWEDELYAL